MQCQMEEQWQQQQRSGLGGGTDRETDMIREMLLEVGAALE